MRSLKRGPHGRQSPCRRARESLARGRGLASPAPDTAAVAWKKAALAGGQHEITDVKTERVERAIAADLAFLAAHPVRLSNRRRQS
jgi:hypothetical protein